MTDLLATFFIDAIPLSGGLKALMCLPLCAAIAVVYKTTRVNHLKDLPKEAANLWITIIVGMYAIGIGIWGIYRILA